MTVKVMTIEEARTWIIVAALSLTTALLVFFFLGPTLGYPLENKQALQLLQILLPVFLGYLGSATHFLFRSKKVDLRLRGTPGQLSLLVKGPVLVFGAGLGALLVAFAISNRGSAPPGAGMSFEAISGGVSATLGLLAVTTNVVASYLFAGGETGKK